MTGYVYYSVSHFALGSFLLGYLFVDCLALGGFLLGYLFVAGIAVGYPSVGRFAVEFHRSVGASVFSSCEVRK